MTNNDCSAKISIVLFERFVIYNVDNDNHSSIVMINITF
jgi:hypothetical protein